MTEREKSSHAQSVFCRIASTKRNEAKKKNVRGQGEKSVREKSRAFIAELLISHWREKRGYKNKGKACKEGGQSERN